MISLDAIDTEKMIKEYFLKQSWEPIREELAKNAARDLLDEYKAKVEILLKNSSS